MIEPSFLARLRQQMRAELVLALVQLDQVCPGYWPDISDLAAQLGTDRATLTRSMRKLETLQLLQRASISNGGGTWIWWVARRHNDQPPPDIEPAWIVRDIHRRQQQRVTITGRWEWAQRHNIPRETMRNFLLGGQMLMRNRWELISTPYDLFQ